MGPCSTKSKGVLIISQRLINQIYDKSWRLRAVDEQYKPFIRETETLHELKIYYNLDFRVQKELKQYFEQFIQVRSDGNSFYTSFGYSYFSILFKDQNNIKVLIKQLSKLNLPMRIQVLQEMEIDNIRDEEILRTDFFKRLQVINQKQTYNERIIELQLMLSAYQRNQIADGCFYGLFVIFLRNYIYYIIKVSGKKDQIFDSEGLLIWENDCKNGEMVLSILADYLKMLFSFKDRYYQLQEYGSEFTETVCLLMRSGLYNIGMKSI